MRDELAPDANIRHRPLLLEEIDKYVTVIGDASKVSTITNAVYEGYPVALDIYRNKNIFIRKIIKALDVF